MRAMEANPGPWPGAIALALVLVILFGSDLAAQARGSITGQVIGPREQPLAGITVGVRSTDHRAITNEQGRFLISGLDVGRYTLFVEAIGYQAAETEVTVGAGESSTVFLQLGDDEVSAFGFDPVPLSELGPGHNGEPVVSPGVCWIDDEGAWFAVARSSPPPVLLWSHARDEPLTAADTLPRVETWDEPLPVTCLCSEQSVELAGYYVSIPGESYKGQLRVVAYNPPFSCR